MRNINMSRKARSGSAGKKILIVISILFFAAACSKKQQLSYNPSPTPTPAVSVTPTPVPTPTPAVLSLPIKYSNAQYGFSFSLPQDWQGYFVVNDSWEGTYLEGNLKSPSGPKILIRNPLWTKAKPYEDIPVMIFTLQQWSDITSEKLSVSAAPIPPTELDRNKNYVFALPARYNYDFSIGWEEVEKIIQSSPLKTSN